MAAQDFFTLPSGYGDTASSNVASGLRHGPSKDTGDLRRKFNFGDRVSELQLMQDPFFRLVSMCAKKPTDDPEFKYTERRPSWHKRYAYVSNHGTSAPASIQGGDASVTAAHLTAGEQYYFTMVTDYLSEGNKTNVHGQSTNEISPGDEGTQPSFFIPGQVVKIPVNSAVTAGSWTDHTATSAVKPNDYVLAKIIEADATTFASGTAGATKNAINLKTEIVKTMLANSELSSYNDFENALDGLDVSGKSVPEWLEPKRSYVIGSAFGEGTGYPQSWKDQPFSTGFGQTQIWKTSMAMTNTARATQLKYEQNEWARMWKEKLIEHKYDIEQSILFGSQGTVDGVPYTQGAVDFISTYGNSFNLNLATKTQDDFLDDLSNLLDPRYNNSQSTVFFCSTAVYNWLHKLGGYFSNNLEISTNLRSDFAVSGRKKILGIDATTISTVYGDMTLVRNIHLDGTNVKILGINMKYCGYRPLVGNGLNRDTSVYVGVQTLENSGVDRRVDLIMTEAGMEWQMPECHSIWV